MSASASSVRIPAPRPPAGRERRFYLGMAVAMSVAVYVGFARSFFLRPLFPGHPAPPEPIFLVHGAVFTAWMVLLVVQAALVGRRRLPAHRRLGWWGAGLAVAMIGVGLYGALVAARRPTGFVGVPVPPLQFLVIPVADIVLFASFVALAVATRNRPQAHKRWMLLATVNLLTAGIARWPGVSDKSPLWFFGLTDLFVLAMIAWDVTSRRRLHPVTLAGGLVLVASQPLRLALSGTAAWEVFARWAIGLLG